MGVSLSRARLHLTGLHLILCTRDTSSLEGVIYPLTPAIEPSHRIRATEIFNQIIDYYEPSQTKTGRYKQITLFRLTYEYALSKVSRDNFLTHFLQAIKIQVDDEFHFEAWDEERKSEPGILTTYFADFLIEKIFLPCK
jgi:hypothetical protein